ncbi:hypothetical protein [Salinivibrio sp. IB643]|jgi:hypothetical protein|uniref:hypothetical protein n=1 Tax=Salinivibrio TaxID=51366 RepID=UPI000988A605|nr:hypothetical protein [Salinivibrio sp. IB643]OOE97921.1 hypothetical protein BZG77_07825 [Salinivibrio sp. IB643]
MKKVILALITSLVTVSGSAMAVNQNMYCNGKQDQSDVCQAYRAGVAAGKAMVTSNVDKVDREEQDKSSSFSERALEHRAGERVRKPLDKDDVKN